MAQRNVQFNLDFNVENLNTIGALEDELQAINKQLEYVDINSDAFKNLSKQAQAVDGKLRQVNTSLDGVTSSERSDSVKKLSEGLVGGFAAAASASVLFGDQTSEAMQKAIQKAGALFVAADGIDKIFKALEGSNIKALKSTVAGFKKSALAAKAFATTTKGALISTGIGALVVAIGLIIANFDKLKEVVKKNAKAIKKSLMIFMPPIWLIIKGVELIKEKFGDLQNLIASVGAFIGKLFKFDGTGLKGATDEFEKQLVIEKELDSLRDDYNEKITETTKEYDQQLELLGLQGDKQQEILDLEIERNQAIVDNLSEQKALGKLKKEELESLEKAVFELKKLEIRQTNLNKKNAEALATEQAKLKAVNATAAAAKKKVEADAVAAELEKAKLQREIQLEALTNRMAQVQEKINGILFNEEMAMEMLNQKTREKVRLSEIQIQQLSLINEEVEGLFGSEIQTVKAMEDFIRKADEATNAAAAIKPPTEDSLALVEIMKGLVGEYNKQRDAMVAVNELTATYTDNNTENKGIILFLSAEQRNQLATLQSQLNVAKEVAAQRADVLDALVKEQEITIATNDKLDQRLRQSLTYLEKQKSMAENDADKLAAEAEINEVQRERQRLLIKTAEAENVIVRATQESYTLQEDVNGIIKQQQILIGESAKVYQTKWEKANLEVQKFLNVTWKDIGTNIQKVFESGSGKMLLDFADAAAMLADSMAALAQTNLDNQTKALDEWYDANADRLEELAELKEEYADEEADLNDLLKDAEGDRYNDLMSQIKAVQALEAVRAAEEKKLANEEIAQQNAIEQARYEADQAAKKAAIVNAAIQGALAVIKALPNLILAGLTGAAVGVGIAAIAKQKVVPAKIIPPIAAEGGLLDGKSHASGGVNVNAEGGEFVTNKAATRAFLPLLDSINAAGKQMAEGGVIGQSNPATPAGQTELIDYERLADTFSKKPMFVSVVEFQDVQNRLQVVESRSSI